MTEKWKIAGTNNPLDARVLPNGNVLIVEAEFQTA